MDSSKMAKIQSLLSQVTSMVDAMCGDSMEMPEKEESGMDMESEGGGDMEDMAVKRMKMKMSKYKEV